MNAATINKNTANGKKTQSTDYYMVNIHSKQFILREGDIFCCDKLKATDGETVTFPVLGSSKSFLPGGKANFKVLKEKLLGEKVVIFYKTKRNADEHYGGRGGARPVLTKLQLINVTGGGD